MAVTFAKLFGLFRGRPPHGELAGAYNDLAAAADSLHKLVSDAKVAYNALLKEKKLSSRTIGFGMLPLKTKAIEDEVLPVLEKLSVQAKGRLARAESKISKIPVSEDERKHILAAIALLNKTAEEMRQIKRSGDISELDDVLRRVGKLFQEFYEAEIYEGFAMRKILLEEIPKNLVDVFAKAQQSTNAVVRMGAEEYLRFWRFSERLNERRDPSYKVVWRRWWESPPKPERDMSFPEPHINATLVVGGRKQNIHIILAH